MSIRQNESSIKFARVKIIYRSHILHIYIQSVPIFANQNTIARKFSKK